MTFWGKIKLPQLQLIRQQPQLQEQRYEASVTSYFFLTVSQNPTQNPSAIKGLLEPVVQHAVHLPKPQLSFKKKPDNSDSPWYPTLTHKYNAQVPLGYVYHDLGADVDESIVYVARLTLH